MKRKWSHLVPIFVGHHHLLHNLFYVFIGGFYYAIHLRSVWRRFVMLDFELRIKFNDHSIVDIGSVISDDPFRDVVPADEVMLDKPGYNILGN